MSERDKERTKLDANEYSSFSYLMYRMTVALIDVDAFMYKIAWKRNGFMGVAIIWILY